jgi:signal transduction histidine kinase
MSLFPLLHISCVLPLQESSNERQIELVNDLLRVAQVDAGKLILNKVPCNITSIVKDAVAEQRASFKKRSQIVEINTPDNPINANVDSARLRMVLDNLIDNASKYTPKNGKITIYVNCSDNELRICVADNGVGVKEEDLPRLFHKFSRVGNELSEEVGGSGLGLYWAHKVVEKHGGKIEVESKHKHGTKFTVIVPSGSENA